MGVAFHQFGELAEVRELTELEIGVVSGGCLSINCKHNSQGVVLMSDPSYRAHRPITGFNDDEDGGGDSGKSKKKSKDSNSDDSSDYTQCALDVMNAGSAGAGTLAALGAGIGFGVGAATGPGAVPVAATGAAIGGAVGAGIGAGFGYVGSDSCP